ncbi:MAG: hypothetical protein H7259_01155, partial [Cytophagales bacterium]|nr:hypothetical protein [Cytophaga sp.]
IQTLIHPFQKELFIWLLIAAVIALISFLLVGLPGGAVLIAIEKTGLTSKIQGDNTWPAALFLSITWPFCLPAGVLVKHYLINNGYAHNGKPGLVVQCTGRRCVFDCYYVYNVWQSESLVSSL